MRYSKDPDCSRCDFHVFGVLKALKGCTFMLDDNVQEAVVWWFRQQPNENNSNVVPL
jgi:hypothetical protein